MTKKLFKSVDEYIASQPDPVPGILKLVRGTIRKALPGADELISYRMPTYKIDGEAVLHFAAWKQHYSLYPASESLVAAFNDELASYKVSKGTIRFPLSEPVPVKLIGRMRSSARRKRPLVKRRREPHRRLLCRRPAGSST